MNSLQDRGLRDGSRPGAHAPATARVVSAPPPPDGHALSVCPVLGPDTGFPALEQTLLAYAPGRSELHTTGAGEEVLFVLSGEGVLHLGAEAHALEPETGAYLAPGETYELEARGAEVLRLVAVRIPDPDRDQNTGATPGAERAVVRRVADQERAAATTQREFRIVADPASGLRSATHFVGYIPTLRAPEHFHTYDEVIYVLDGEGVMHCGGADQPVSAGSSIQLPARTVHCLENTGDRVMRIVAVFRPAGSPAAAYYPDGTPAYTPTGGDR
jgi:mannose-6-phosphate isomerase-like protein (cupin superfamily)